MRTVSQSPVMAARGASASPFNRHSPRKRNAATSPVSGRCTSRCAAVDSTTRNRLTKGRSASQGDWTRTWMSSIAGMVERLSPVQELLNHLDEFRRLFKKRQMAALLKDHEARARDGLVDAVGGRWSDVGVEAAVDHEGGDKEFRQLRAEVETRQVGVQGTVDVGAVAVGGDRGEEGVPVLRIVEEHREVIPHPVRARRRVAQRGGETEGVLMLDAVGEDVFEQGDRVAPARRRRIDDDEPADAVRMAGGISHDQITAPGVAQKIDLLRAALPPQSVQVLDLVRQRAGLLAGDGLAGPPLVVEDHRTLLRQLTPDVRNVQIGVIEPGSAVDHHERRSSRGTPSLEVDRGSSRLEGAAGFHRRGGDPRRCDNKSEDDGETQTIEHRLRSPFGRRNDTIAQLPQPMQPDGGAGTVEPALRRGSWTQHAPACPSLYPQYRNTSCTLAKSIRPTSASIPSTVRGARSLTVLGKISSSVPRRI